MERERCPICHAEALYVGLDELECPTAECPNYGSRDARSTGEQLLLELDQLVHELWCRGRAE
jgi:hypothetical protein